MEEELYKELCHPVFENLKFRRNFFEKREKGAVTYYYAYVKLPDGERVLFFNLNGKHFFKSKRTLVAQIYNYLSYSNNEWKDSENEKKRFLKENVEFFGIVLPVTK